MKGISSIDYQFGFTAGYAQAKAENEDYTYKKIVAEIIRIIRTVEYPEYVEDEIIKLFVRTGIFESESVKKMDEVEE